MIFNSDINAQRNASYEATIKNLEKAQQLLDERYRNKQISDADYIKKSNEIKANIDKYKRVIGQDY